MLSTSTVPCMAVQAVFRGYFSRKLFTFSSLSSLPHRPGEGSERQLSRLPHSAGCHRLLEHRPMDPHSLRPEIRPLQGAAGRVTASSDKRSPSQFNERKHHPNKTTMPRQVTLLLQLPKEFVSCMLNKDFLYLPVFSKSFMF